MKVVFGETEARRHRAGGLKPLIASILGSPYINPAVRQMARLLPKQIGHRLPLRLHTVCYKPVAAKPVKMLDSHRDLFARDVFWGKGQPTSPADARVLRVVERLCADGGVFADVGSYAAVFAMLAARSHPKLKAVAYEIVPENFLLIIRNVLENDLVRQVDCKLLGLAAAPGAIRLPLRLNMPSNASSVSIGSQFSDGVEIPLSTLDLESAGWEGPLVMKIDVEGFELEVFMGGEQTMQRLKPDIICEILPGGEDTAHQRIEAMLRPLGYRFFQSQAEAFVPRENIVPSESGRDWLFTCRPNIHAVLAACG